MVNLLVKTFEHVDLEKLDKEVNEWSKEKDVKFITPYSRDVFHCKQVLYLEKQAETKPVWVVCKTCGKYVDTNKYSKCVNGHEVK